MANDTQCTPALRAQHTGWRLETTVLACWIPFMLAVTVRLITRQRSPGGFGPDDYFMMFAIIPVCLGSIFVLLSVHYGLGRHMVCLDSHDVTNTIKFQELAEMMNIISVWALKMSICFFLLRLIEGIHRKARGLIWFLAALNTSLNLVALVVFICLKLPFRSWWDFDVKPTESIIVGGARYLRAVFIINVVIDFVFAFSPIYFLWDVKIRRRHKYTLWGLLILAIAPSVAGLLKALTLNQVNEPTDPTYTPLGICDISSVIEQTGGAFVINLPYLKKPIQDVLLALSKKYGRLLPRYSNDEQKNQRLGSYGGVSIGSTTASKCPNTIEGVQNDATKAQENAK